MNKTRLNNIFYSGLFLLFIITIVTAIININFYKKKIINESKKSQIEQISFTRKAIESSFTNQVKLIDAISENELHNFYFNPFLNFDDTSHFSFAKTQFDEHSGYINSLTLYDKNFNKIQEYIHNGYKDTGSQKQLNNKKRIKYLDKKSSFNINSISYKVSKQLLNVSVIKPVNIKNSIIGYSEANFNLAQIINEYIEPSRNKSLNYFLLNNSQIVYTNNNQSGIIDFPNLIQNLSFEALQSQNKPIKSYLLKKAHKLFLLTEVEIKLGNNFTLILLTDLNPVLKSVKYYTLRLYAAFGLMILVFILLSFILFKSKKDQKLIKIKTNYQKNIYDKNEALKSEKNKLDILIKKYKELNNQLTNQNQKLSESENRFRSFFERNKVMMLQVDVETKQILNANKAACQFYKYKKEELIGKNISEINLLKPGDINNKMKNALVNDSNYFEFKHKIADGKIKDVEVFASPIKLNNKVNLFLIINDITDKVEVQKELALNEKRFRILSDLTFEGIIIHDNGIVLDVNERFLQLFGYQKEELLNKNIIPIIIPAKYMGVIEKKLNLEYAQPYPLEIYKIDKTLTPVEIESQVIDFNGKKARVAAFRDVSYIQKTENELLKSNQKLAFHIEQTPLGVIEWDLNFKVTAWNKAAEYIFGYNSKEAIGKHASFIVPQIYKEQVDEIWNELIDKALSNTSENENITKKGRHIYCHWFNTPLVNHLGDVIGVASLVQDKTKEKKAENELRLKNQELQSAEEELRASNEELTATNDALRDNMSELERTKSKIEDSEEKFKTAFKTSPDSVNINRLHDGKYIEINDGFTKITGYTWEDVKGKSSSDIDIWVNKNDRQKLTDTLLSKNVCHNLEAKFRMKNGSIITGLMSAKVIELHGEKHILSITRNIQKIKDAESALIKAKVKAEESDRLKSAFLANMSHEVRTPMNGIIGFIQLLKSPGISEEKRWAFMDIIENSGNQLLSIINDLVDISKIETGSIQIHKKEINVYELLSGTFQNFNPQAIAKGLKFVLEAENEIKNLTINNDESRLKQVINNLISNALKFTNKGKITFGVKKKNNILEFYVKDTGIGIEKDNFEIIFERFRQLEQTTKRQYGGTGLGLAISRSIINLIGEKIWVESEFGKGSAFYFTIPYKNKKEVKNKLSMINYHQITWDNKKILVAEDEESNYQYLKEVLAGKNANLTRANNGFEAVEQAKTNTFDVILMDIKMPIMDGKEAARIIKEFKPNLPIIAQTAFALDSDKDNFLQNGFDDYISKPISINALLEKIEAHFKN